MQSVLFVITALVIQRIQGFGTGAPASKCGDMFPSHSQIQPENSLPPYTLTASSYTYKQGDTITSKSVIRMKHVKDLFFLYYTNYFKIRSTWTYGFKWI